MEINLSALESAISAEIESNNNNNNFTRENTSEYKVFYPYVDGQYEIRLFFNFKANKVQRLITRHGNEGKNPKVACLSAYGEECPACKVVKEIENLLGKESGISRKFGYSKRGICFAQIIDGPGKVFQGEYAAQKGDIVLLMYPKSVYDAINGILMSAIKSKKFDDIANSNTAYHITINKDSSKGPNAYQVLQTFTQSTLYKNDSEFENFIGSLPNLDEQILPINPTSEIYKATKVFAETLTSQYLSNGVVNPNGAVVGESKPAAAKLNEIIDDTPTSDVNDLKEIPIDDDDIPFDTKPVGNTNNSEKPNCFGKYDKENSTCWLCPHDIDCQKQNA